MKTIHINIHTKNNYDYTTSIVYQTLSSLYTIHIGKASHINIYFDYEDHHILKHTFRNDINIHIVSNPQLTKTTALIPDMNVFDYALGYESIIFEDRYYNMNNNNTADNPVNTLTGFLKNIFDPDLSHQHISKRANEVIHLYYDTKENVWHNHLFLKKHTIKTHSVFYTLIDISAFFIRWKKRIAHRFRKSAKKQCQ